MKYPTTQSSLLERLQEGDGVSWEDFFYRYAPVIRAAGAGFNFNETECDDLVQLVMLKFFNHAGTFVYRKGEVKFRSYFAKVIRNQAVDMIRKSAAQKNLPGESPEDPDPFQEIFRQEWEKALLDEAKCELRSRVDAKTYQAFELYALQNRPVKAVADVLDMTPEQLYAVKNRCLAMLKKIIARYKLADEELDLDL